MKVFSGSALKALREKAKLTQDGLAVEVSVAGRKPVGTAQISRYERGEIKPSADMLSLLAESLKCSIDAFFSEFLLMNGSLKPPKRPSKPAKPGRGARVQ